MNVFNLENHLNIFFNKDIFLRNIFFFFLSKIRFTGKSKIIASAKNNFTKPTKYIKKGKKILMERKFN